MKLFITGYMASGKTTFGKALAEKISMPFIDLDEYIEQQTSKTISEIFSEKGEDGFRRLESDMLKKASLEYPDFVIACGGGTPCFLNNMEYLNETGVTVFLETSIPVLISRLQEENRKRPLVAGKTDDEIREHVLNQLCERLPYYMESKLRWSGDDLETSEQIDTNTDNFINSYPSLFR